MTDEQEKVDPVVADETKAAVAEHPALIVSKLLAIYAAMMNGQVWRNPAITDSDRISAFASAAEILSQAHAMSVAWLRDNRKASPEWAVSGDKAKETACLIFAKMTEGQP